MTDASRTIGSLRPRADGWTPAHCRHFLLTLARTGSVACACAAVGRSRASAYRLRARPGAARFAVAWDSAVEAGKLHPRLARRPDRAGLARLAELDRIINAAIRAEGDTSPRQGVHFVHFRAPGRPDASPPAWHSAPRG